MTVNVDGMVDSAGVRYVGEAKRQLNGKWVALADVGGNACMVECNITFSSTASKLDAKKNPESIV